MADDETRVVLMTAPDRETAERVATGLVTERLAACANVLPGIASVYWWEGSVERADEVLVILKTRRDRMDALIGRARELHPYDVPEVLALPVREGLPDYVEWVRSETGGQAS